MRINVPVSRFKCYGDPVGNFAEVFGSRKLESLGYSAALFCVILRLAALVQCWLVTDGRTDGQIDRHTTTTYTSLA